VSETPHRRRIARLWPVAVVLLALAAAYALGLHRYVSFETLGQRRRALQALVMGHPVLAGAIYVAAYIAIVAISLPGSLVMTIAGGLLFGTAIGAACAVVGATAGAVLLFLAARYAIGDLLAARAGPFMERIRAGLEADGFSYLLALRLVPVFPFWLMNLAPALVRMRLAPFAAATFLGIIPGTAVFASIGAGLGAVLAEGRQPDVSVALRPQVILPLLGLALLSLLPIAVRRSRARPGA
jgi:uncharacterized membrane protein YdjX (TVP38/TMEM64 family)